MEEECPICLNDMNIEEGILLLECCNNNVHLSCLLEWCSTEGKPTTCILCNQSNKFLVETQERTTEIIIEQPPRNSMIMIRFLCYFCIMITFMVMLPYLIREIS